MAKWKHIAGDGAWGETGTEYDVRVTSDGEMAVTSTEQERNVHAAISATGIVADGYLGLIDLSDTTTYPHDSTGRIDISWLKIAVDLDVNTEGRVSVGVVTELDATDGSVSFLFTVPFDKSSERRILSINNFAPSQLKFGVSGGALTHAITNNVDANTTLIQNDVALTFPSGSVVPAVGDIVVWTEWTTGAYDLTVEVLYHSEA